MTNYNKNEPETIQAMFGSIAGQYDKVNAINSLQLHKKWNQQLIGLTAANNPSTLLDLCCGTGDIALSYLNKSSTSKQAVMLDFCEEMLQCAKKKAEKLNLGRHQISYIKADAQEIPLASETIPCATMAYGIRNIQDPLKCMKEVYRVLQPGGSFGILELTRPSNPFLRAGHYLYLTLVLPLIGKLVTSNQEAYQYLGKSIHRFMPADELEKMMREAGFQQTSQKKLSAGIATIVIGQKA